MASTPLISVIIVNFNSGNRLAKCLAHLDAQTFADFEVIVIDNASGDGSADGLADAGGGPGSSPGTRWIPSSRPSAAQSRDLSRAAAGEVEAGPGSGPGTRVANIIRSPTNTGFAAGNNVAVKQARGQWLAFLNPDAYGAPDWLEKLVAATQKYPWADAFGSTQIDALHPERLDGVGDVYHAFGVPYRGNFGHPSTDIPPDGECFSPCAAAALYRRETFERLGGFDESYFCYGEDVDLGFRLRLAGGRAVQIGDAVVHHEGSAVSGRYSDFTVYHGNRNRIWCWFKNMPLALLIVLLPFHLLVNVYLLARSFSVGIGKPFWRAMVDGYGGLGPVMRARGAVQQSKTISTGNLSRALTWSPLKVSRRQSDLKPLARNN